MSEVLLSEHFLLTGHSSACWFMTGVIWLVQVLVYPNFRLVPAASFAGFHAFHTRRISWVVAPAMALELVSGLALALLRGGPLFWGNLFLIALTWLITAAVSVPLHNQLEKDPSRARAKDWLIWTNWSRTVIWTLRSLIWTLRSFCLVVC